jgi:hypothetical protein
LLLNLQELFTKSFIINFATIISQNRTNLFHLQHCALKALQNLPVVSAGKRSLVFGSFIDNAIAVVAITISTANIDVVDNSGTVGVTEAVGAAEVVGVAETEEPTAVTESTEVDGFTRLMVPSDASWESSTSLSNSPVVPVLVTVNVTVAIVPVPVKAGVVEPVEVANKWYSPSDWEASLFTTSTG